MSQAFVSVGRTSVTLCRGSSKETLQRFRDIKSEIRDRHGTDLEITNEMVLSTLCDLYWLHYDRDGPPVAAAGGEPQ